MKRGRRTFSSLLLVLVSVWTAKAEPVDALYTSKAIVTGTGEKNRQPGFRDCLERVLVRVSGDPRLLTRPEMAGLRARAALFVKSFTYRDRLAGKPIHDEQGSYDRPHDLTCRFDPAVVDPLLAALGSRPWLERRPVLTVFLEVRRGTPPYRLNRQDPRDQAMREAFVQAASPMAMRVVFPPAEVSGQSAGGETDARAARDYGGDLPLYGTLAWSDADLGWVATWGLEPEGKRFCWTVRGVNFDEAFRVGIRGAAQILSGHGVPE